MPRFVSSVVQSKILSKVEERKAPEIPKPDKDPISRDFTLSLLKQGYKFKTFSWTHHHEDLELLSTPTTVQNPDGAWRSAQGDLKMENS